MRTRRGQIAAGVITAAVLVAAGSANPGAAAVARHDQVGHVLLISVDGLHQSDLAWYVAHHPASALAALAGGGVEYSQARTTFPSDSFPGMLAQVTGATPKTTGVYYDDSYNRSLLPAGTTSCAGAKPGAEVTYFEELDRNQDSIDAGQGLSGLPGSILSLTGSPEQLIDPAKLPVDPATCKPVYPHSYSRVNTVFEVARAHGLVTAWSDKHPAYDILQGPSGQGIEDLFTPEINSLADPAGHDWTKVNSLTQQYDGYKVRAVLNQIDGYDHSRSVKLGTPAIFGLNFQSVSTAEKLPSSGGQPGGYLADGVTPGPVLAGALDYVDREVGRFTAELAARGLGGDTAIILSAKHGQAPTIPAQLTRIDDGAIVDAMNAAWTAAGHTAPLVAFSIDDDAMLMWLTDRSGTATAFARHFLAGYSGSGTDIAGAAKPFTSSGLATVYAGQSAAAFIGTSTRDPRVPDLIGLTQPGVVYTGGTGKIAEHGGNADADRHVPILLAVPGAHSAVVTDSPVSTTQIAPTILRLLGLDPDALSGVRAEHTAVLPGRG
ncbi:MAG: hypothetical protein QOD41_2633 [Cryptosporangiaceae bacterium]|nr:hypothetical protein [Cryptosporangiaceae bacterium]